MFIVVNYDSGGLVQYTLFTMIFCLHVLYAYFTGNAVLILFYIVVAYYKCADKI